MLPYSNLVNKTIYINPNFKGQLPMPETIQSMQSTNIPKNAHINPLFLKTDKSRNTIHMNPAFLQTFQERQELRLEVQKKISHEDSKICPVFRSKTIAPINSSEKEAGLEERKIICKSKNCLIREPLIKNVGKLVGLETSPVPQQPLLILNKRKLVRKVSLFPDASKIPKGIETNDFRTKITKYKLDNRLAKKKPLLPPTPRIKRACFVGRYALRRNSFSETTNIPAKISFNKNKNKNLKVLNINGLFYKSTRNSLKLKDVPTNHVLKSCNSGIASGKTNLNANQGLAIFVRGNKYVMDANKYKLTRVTNYNYVSSNRANLRKSLTCQRIDIGGYTYISTNSTKNVLVRTTNHLSRAYVHNAKQKSLQMLAKRFMKTNIPCPIFQHIGKCAAFERGKCSKVHNKLQVTICSNFLRGECHNTKCLLSHNVSLSKMPVCKFYLQGVCVRNDCPYLHKKLSNATEICREFLRGFCHKADKCDKRHEFVCLEAERNNKCENKNCVFCNAKKRRESQIKLKSVKLKNELSSSSGSFTTVMPKDDTNSQSSKRYFIESLDGTFENSDENNVECIKECITDNMIKTEILEENTENSADVRPKLGALPAYIPL